MNIKNFEEAKKYIGKKVFTATEVGKIGKYKTRILYIGGVHMFYNQVDFDVIGFELYENAKFTDGWGQVKVDDISKVFEIEGRFVTKHYFMALPEAEKYALFMSKSDAQQEKDYEVKHAIELLKKHKVKHEIFE